MPRPQEQTSLALALSLLCGSIAVLAEEEPSAFHKDLLGNLEFTGQQLVSLAEATPPEMFSWRATKDVRSVSEIYMHIVGMNLLMPPTLGAQPPEGVTVPDNPFDLMNEWETTVTAKEAVVARLRESFEYLAKAIPQIQDLDAEVAPSGVKLSKRSFLIIVLGHAHEHLGQSIAYARNFGIVPPWSPAQAAIDN